jgi:hypothetical protein
MPQDLLSFAIYTTAAVLLFVLGIRSSKEKVSAFWRRST